MDGHVAVSHGGIEMGQGLNTKVIQTVAESLGIAMDRVKNKPSNNFVAANGVASGGSVTSEIVC
jgi:xanthine dehydrogenase molybdopterin-binding subunit B